MKIRRADPLRTVGNVLLALGVAAWAVYAVLRYALGWNVTGLQFLPYHLAGVVPGMLLRRHHFFRRLLRQLLHGSRNEAPR
jgi:hypothetical protein